MVNVKILRLDISGKPVGWAAWQEAVCLYTKNKVIWTVGDQEFRFMGGVSRFTGERSSVSINSIIAVKGSQHYIHPKNPVPQVSNHELFRRDGHLCMYCGCAFSERHLTRDHIIPIHQGGSNDWTNVVAACKSCNTRKGGRTPEQANMPLLAIPYEPNWVEYLILTNRKILLDQMEFLKSQAGKKSRMFP